MMDSQARWPAYISLLSAMFLWGGSFVAMKIAFRSYDPMVVMFGRMIVASLCLLFFLKRFSRTRFRKSDLKYLLLLVLCDPCLYFIFEANALENTSASQAGIIVSMLPLMVAVAAQAFLKEHVTRKSLTGFAAAIVGAVGLSLTAEVSENAPNPALGNFLEFVAMLCATGYVVALKRLTLSLSPFFLTAMQALAGTGFFLVLLFLPSTTLPSRFDPTATLAVVYLGAFVTLGAYGFYNFGMSRIPASQASSFLNLIPVFTILLDWIIFGEQLRLVQYAAVALILVGVMVSQERSG
jgi:drug/metabolite transporter (DMT)-like permease